MTDSISHCQPWAEQGASYRGGGHWGYCIADVWKDTETAVPQSIAVETHSTSFYLYHGGNCCSGEDDGTGQVPELCGEAYFVCGAREWPHTPWPRLATTGTPRLEEPGDGILHDHPVALSKIMERHADVFKDELGLMDKFNAKLVVKPEAQSQFCQPRPLPFAMIDAVERELDRLENTEYWRRSHTVIGQPQSWLSHRATARYDWRLQGDS